MSTYVEKLRDPRWQKKRLEVLQAADWACEDCGRRDQQLEIHHCAYVSGLEPWEYGGDLLMCLCTGCHQRRQKFEDMQRIYQGRRFRMMHWQDVEIAAWGMAQQFGELRSEKDWSEAFS